MRRSSGLHGKDGLTLRIHAPRSKHNAEIISLTGNTPCEGPAIDPYGFDPGKKIKGKKRHILVDTQGLRMHAIVHAADVQDRDGGALLMASLFDALPFLIKLYADGGYQGPELPSAMKRILARVNLEIVKRSRRATGFVALPKRWIVERTLAGSLPTTGQGLGMPQPQGARLPLPRSIRLMLRHAAKTMQSGIMFSDRLLVLLCHDGPR